MGNGSQSSRRQLLIATFAYLVAIGGIIATLGAAFAGNQTRTALPGFPAPVQERPGKNSRVRFKVLAGRQPMLVVSTLDRGLRNRVRYEITWDRSPDSRARPWEASEVDGARVGRRSLPISALPPSTPHFARVKLAGYRAPFPLRFLLGRALTACCLRVPNDQRGSPPPPMPNPMSFFGYLAKVHCVSRLASGEWARRSIRSRRCSG